MKNKAFIISLVLTFVCIAGKMPAQSYKTKYNVDDSKIALQGYSPVSYVELGLAQRGSKAFKSEYDEVHYYFTSETQKSKFDSNPSKYLPAFGGWCATGIAVGAKFRTDPNKFLVRNGKLYLFLYDVEVDALQLWLEDENSLTSKANKNWEEFQSNP